MSSWFTALYTKKDGTVAFVRSKFYLCARVFWELNGHNTESSTEYGALVLLISRILCGPWRVKGLLDSQVVLRTVGTLVRALLSDINIRNAQLAFCQSRVGFEITHRWA